MFPLFNFVLFLFRAFLHSVLSTAFLTLVLYLCRVEDWLLLMLVYLICFSFGFYLTYFFFMKIIRLIGKKYFIFKPKFMQFILLMILTEVTWILISFTNLYDTKNNISPRFTIVDLICMSSIGFHFVLDFIREYLTPKRTKVDPPLDDLTAI